MKYHNYLAIYYLGCFGKSLQCLCTLSLCAFSQIRPDSKDVHVHVGYIHIYDVHTEGLCCSLFTCCDCGSQCHSDSYNNEIPLVVFLLVTTPTPTISIRGLKRTTALFVYRHVVGLFYSYCKTIK